MAIIVFDFDDTIFATSHFIGKEPVVCPELVASINQLLDLASKNGEVFIITNAERAWIKLCLQRYLPGCDSLQKHFDGNTIISTKDTGISNQAEVCLWKTIAFDRKFEQQFKDESPRQLVCFGDNEYDRLASLIMREKYKNVVVKNTLLLHNPSLEAILKQHQIMIQILPKILEHYGHLDLYLYVETKPQTESTTQKSSGETDLRNELRE
jgi:hypothetical protein